jgi:CBS domain containing-hemolysin-like protein
MASGMISASEVAFFSLSDKTLSDFKESKVAVEKQIYSLVFKQRKNLLATILILNNTVNVAIVMLSTSLGKFSAKTKAELSFFFSPSAQLVRLFFSANCCRKQQRKEKI